jgi:hypothetical protein
MKCNLMDTDKDLLYFLCIISNYIICVSLLHDKVYIVTDKPIEKTCNFHYGNFSFVECKITKQQVHETFI